LRIKIIKSVAYLPQKRSFPISKGNGIKTVIVNMVDVAKALNRPPTCEHCFKKLFHCNFLTYG
uniref:Uncharacterized protein n=1 Tax=Sinocyclocheilus anshuiensis TaxID=1608454 RepID=A0A671Q0B4_9TELE